MDVSELMLSEKDSGGDEYKSGWNDAVCYIFDTCTVTNRDKEPINIELNISLDKEILEVIKCKSQKKN